MLINIDAKQLEWVCATYLSKDKVAYDEIKSGIDIHANNQERFGLPERVVAKVFLFRLLYGGSAYAFANDPDFTHVSCSESYWNRVIESAYTKYTGLAKWHQSLVSEVVRTGCCIVPATQRKYFFTKEYGEWPRPKILNYPVQGLGHDLMAILRCLLKQMLSVTPSGLQFISTVHDSVLLDVEKINSTLLKQLFTITHQVPLDFEARFGVEFDLPFRVEIKVGPNWGSFMNEIDENAYSSN